jgi:hypothetical protein
MRNRALPDRTKLAPYQPTNPVGPRNGTAGAAVAERPPTCAGGRMLVSVPSPERPAIRNHAIRLRTEGSDGAYAKTRGDDKWLTPGMCST